MAIPAAFIAVVMIWSTTPLAIQWSTLGTSFGFAVFSRMVIGVVLCALLLAALRIRMPWRRGARLTYLAGGVGLFVAMTLTYWSSQYISSGLISVLFGLSPLMTSVIAAYWLDEEALTPAKLAGMLLGVLGLTLVFHHNLNLGPHAFAGIAALLGAVLAQSASMVAIKRIADQGSPVATNLGTLVVALPLFGATWWVSDGQLPAAMPERAAMAIVYLGLFGSVLGFVLYYYLIKHLATAQVALITLITPVLALWLGHALNQEVVSLDVWLGTGGILLGLSLHQWGDRIGRRITA